MIALDGPPGVAQVAIQGGRSAAGQIKARLAGRPDGQPFEYKDKGSMATISRFSAVASIGRLRFTGGTLLRRCLPGPDPSVNRSRNRSQNCGPGQKHRAETSVA